jgi:hypothetical protein
MIEITVLEVIVYSRAPSIVMSRFETPSNCVEVLSEDHQQLRLYRYSRSLEALKALRIDEC